MPLRSSARNPLTPLPLPTKLEPRERLIGPVMSLWFWLPATMLDSNWKKLRAPAETTPPDGPVLLATVDELMARVVVEPLAMLTIPPALEVETFPATVLRPTTIVAAFEIPWFRMPPP